MKKIVSCMAVVVGTAVAMTAWSAPPSSPTKGTGVPPGFGRCTAGKAACPIECYGGMVCDSAKAIIEKDRIRDSEKKPSLAADTMTYFSLVNQKTKSSKTYKGTFAEVSCAIADGLFEMRKDTYLEPFITTMWQASYVNEASSIEAGIDFNEAGDVANIDVSAANPGAGSNGPKANITITGDDAVIKLFNDKAKSLKAMP